MQKYVVIFRDEAIRKCSYGFNAYKLINAQRQIKKATAKKNNKDHVFTLVLLLVKTFLTSFRSASLWLSEYTHEGHLKMSPG